MRTTLWTIQLKLLDCELLSGGKTGDNAATLVRLIEAQGGRFIDVQQYGQASYHADPMVEMNSDGNFMATLTVSHSKLTRSPFEAPVFKHFDPTADFSYLDDSKSLVITQGAANDELPTADEIAHGQLALGLHLFAHLQPKYGYVDELGDNSPRGTSIAKTELTTILWGNILGRQYVEKYGRQLFLSAPGWKKEELANGGMLYVPYESYREWHAAPSAEVFAYFRSTCPNIRPYRAIVGV